MSRRWGRIGARLLLFYVPLALTLLFVLVPFLWALSTSLKRESDVISSAVSYIPQPVTLENYVKVWTQNNFSGYFLNSLLVSVVSVAVITVLALLNGYALSRFKFRGRGRLC
ncbi:hypothetical protein HMSSN036_03030 [Paenibacillus macerans]|nr:hypothetical protein HMSSN036_03030 [Paenibacillus macerans]